MTNEKNEYLDFKKPAAAEVLLSWWRNLDNTRGDRAMLRRCQSYDEVAFSPAYHRLRMDLRSNGFSFNNERLAVVAGVISHVREDQRDNTFAGLMATPKKKGDTPRVSEIRFKKLLSVDELVGLYPSMIRLVKMTDGAAPIPDLANGLYWWNERTKKEWAFAYYDKIV